MSVSCLSGHAKSHAVNAPHCFDASHRNPAAPSPCCSTRFRSPVVATIPDLVANELVCQGDLRMLRMLNLCPVDVTHQASYLLICRRWSACLPTCCLSLAIVAQDSTREHQANIEVGRKWRRQAPGRARIVIHPFEKVICVIIGEEHGEEGRCRRRFASSSPT
jgi:hypothetical protein